ncbi:MAG: glycosyltransferase involved in cell wall biosynthesis [Arenicella sp.]|jgi:glycosyltransferase involved in cell wall biosynthesis/predicted metal-dependent phosphoesterase TrpH
MTKADLHVHSKYSDQPSTWGHKVYNSPESFTDVETVYLQAKTRGMDFVTLTDHDDIRGSLELVRSHPEDCFISCEVTTFFPEDNCKAHILVYGISQSQYQHLMVIAKNIYLLRDYVVEQNIAYSVAHATYDQDGQLTFEHIEKLIVLFDVFEVINGASGRLNNTLLHNYLNNLDKPTLELLQEKHNLKSISTDPWVKGFTGGSDDHCGILIGSAYTESSGHSVSQYLHTIRDKKSIAGGDHGSFESFATGIIKHVHDYRANSDTKYSSSKMSDFLDLFFDDKEGNLVKRFKKSQSLRFLKKKNTKTHKALAELLQQIQADIHTDMSLKIPQTYQLITDLHDEMFRAVIEVFSKHLPSGDIFKGFNRLASLFPMSLLVIPFLGAMRHQALNVNLKRKLIEGANLNSRQAYVDKALWFTDTIDDLNGVSVTLRQIASYGTKHGYNLKLVTCVNSNNLVTPLPPASINFEPIMEITAPGYNTQKIGFPSLLKVMRSLTEEQPDQIIISTPGPLGMAALLCAKILDVPVKTVYHTDFAEQVMRISNEPSVARAVDFAVNLFYKQSDQIFVPSQFYIDKLAQSGLNRQLMTIFPRGLDLQLYSPAPEADSVTISRPLIRRHQLHGSFTLLFAGRISEDKNLSLLIEIIKRANSEQPGTYNLVVAGDGPDLPRLKIALAHQDNVLFTGRLSPEALVEWYRSVDLLIFPSHTDTFGMVVLEAQACGLPCIVTATGGPKEIILPSKTGQIIHRDSPVDWLAMIEQYRILKVSWPDSWSLLTKLCSDHAHKQNGWQPVFDCVLGDNCRLADSLGGSELELKQELDNAA